MAKVKKQNVMVEELFDQALVPEDVQPYELPRNWCWVKFGCLAMDMADGPFGSNLKREHYTEKKEVRIIQLSNIGENGWRDENTKYTTYEHAKTISRSMVKSGEIVIAKMMPAGRAIKVPDEEKAYILSSDAVKFVPKKLINTDYLLYAINSNAFRNQVSLETQGITRARTSIGKMKTYAFPLPPLTEQQRIVDRIQSQFSKLDQAKDLAQNALDRFETRKAAILHKAFTGELTAKWREEHGVGMENWGVRTLTELCETIVDCPHSTPQWSTEGKICLRTTNIKAGYLDLNEIRYISEESFEERIQRLKPRDGDILFTREGTVGDVAIIPEGLEICMGQRMMLLRPSDHVIPSLIVYYLRSPKVLEFIRLKTGGSTSQHINVKDVKQIAVPTPSLSEQKEIVSILDSLFKKEHQSRELADVIDKIDLMKKSILARAFRGQLGTNDPSEESAVELLKEVLANK